MTLDQSIFVHTSTSQRLTLSHEIQYPVYYHKNYVENNYSLSAIEVNLPFRLLKIEIFRFEIEIEASKLLVPGPISASKLPILPLSSHAEQKGAVHKRRPLKIAKN